MLPPVVGRDGKSVRKGRRGASRAIRTRPAARLGDASAAALRSGVSTAAATPFKPSPTLPPDMPSTMEVKCVSDDCELDMFENHYTYDVPDDHAVEDLSCPYCGGSDLVEIEV
jgi:hypothetical protein